LDKNKTMELKYNTPQSFYTPLPLDAMFKYKQTQVANFQNNVGQMDQFALAIDRLDGENPYKQALYDQYNNIMVGMSEDPSSYANIGSKLKVLAGGFKQAMSQESAIQKSRSLTESSVENTDNIPADIDELREQIRVGEENGRDVQHLKNAEAHAVRQVQDNPIYQKAYGERDELIEGFRQKYPSMDETAINEAIDLMNSGTDFNEDSMMPEFMQDFRTAFGHMLDQIPILKNKAEVAINKKMGIDPTANELELQAARGNADAYLYQRAKDTGAVESLLHPESYEKTKLNYNVDAFEKYMKTQGEDLPQGFTAEMKSLMEKLYNQGDNVENLTPKADNLVSAQLRDFQGQHTPIFKLSQDNTKAYGEIKNLVANQSVKDFLSAEQISSFSNDYEIVKTTQKSVARLTNEFLSSTPEVIGFVDSRAQGKTGLIIKAPKGSVKDHIVVYDVDKGLLQNLYKKAGIQEVATPFTKADDGASIDLPDLSDPTKTVASGYKFQSHFIPGSPDSYFKAENEDGSLLSYADISNAVKDESPEVRSHIKQMLKKNMMGTGQNKVTSPFMSRDAQELRTLIQLILKNQ